MLANAIYLPNPTTIDREFNEIEIYFDTTFLINSLGYAGDARKEPCVELLQLLYETAANLNCFRHTFDEIKGILDACASRIEKGQTKYSYGSTIEYFLTTGATASDIRLYSLKLKENLSKLGIKISNKPDYVHEYVPNEDEMSNIIDGVINYQNPNALARDVDSISSVLRLRMDKEYYRVEDCKALFVITNYLLFKASCYYYYNYKKGAQNSIAPCLTDYTLTNLLWLKKPTKAPELPRKRIIADTYAATHLDEKLMNRYFREINKLERSQKISADDVFLLRYEMGAKCALMQLTLGEEEGFTEGTVKEILNMVHDKIKHDMEAKVKDFLIKEKGRSEKIKFIANKISKWMIRPIASIIFILILIGSIYTIPWRLSPLREKYWDYIVFIPFVLFWIITLMSIWKGASIKEIIGKTEHKLEEKIIYWIKRMVEV